MKKLLFLTMLFTSVFAYSQEKEVVYDFSIVKTYTEKSERIAYFNLVNVTDRAHADKIVEALKNDDKILYASIFTSRNGGYKCQVTTKLDVNASYVIDLLKPFDVTINSKDIIKTKNI